MLKTIRNILGHLLHVANASPSMCDKRAFYSMKERIIDKWGTFDGHDVQHIDGKGCYACDATGEGYAYDPQLDEHEPCWKCGGDGWYKRPKWVLLERSKLGSYAFHRPVSTSFVCPTPCVTTIRGYVNHESYSPNKTLTAHFVLAVLFDWSQLWKMLSTRRYASFSIHPIRLLNSLLFRSRVIYCDATTKCRYCNRHTWNSCCFSCSRCRFRVEGNAYLDEIPF